jgi:hypothetical protein
MKIFKIQTTRIVSSAILQDFWVEAADEDEAREKLEDSGFSGFADGIEEGDDNWLGDDETSSVEIVWSGEESQ